MTNWGLKKIYKVSSVVLEKNPLNTYFNADGQKVSLFNYFRDKYGVVLVKTQPLLEIAN